MCNYEFVETADGSVGLFDNKIQDIYHSRHGALKESIEKFIFPSGLVEFAKNNDEIKILDICYGVGYNTKSALNIISETNKNAKTHIDALEYNEELVFISPLIKDNIDNSELKLFLLSQILCSKKINTKKCINNIKTIINSHEAFFDKNIIQLFDSILSDGSCSTNEGTLSASLHNIYYKYISNSTKRPSKFPLFRDCGLIYYLGDARKRIKELNYCYDFIFLDAFTPQKDPTLWTYDFLNLVKSRMHSKSILITYSNSTPFRSTLLELGFYVGKIEIDKKQFGTIASYHKNSIKTPLNEYDIELTKTTGGIMYKDPTLDLSVDEIIFKRKTKQEKSDRITLSKFKKNYLL